MLEFEKEKKDGLNGRVYVAFVEKKMVTGKPFRIVATEEGVSFRNDSPVVETNEDLQILAKTVSLAWTEHLKLKRALREELMGPNAH